MTLNQIEERIRANFIFDKNGVHPLSTDQDYELSQQSALIVFAAIAKLQGFKATDIIKFLGISKSQHEVLLMKFVQAHNEFKNAELCDLYDEPTMNKKIIAKMKLVMNALKIGYPKENYITIDEFGY